VFLHGNAITTSQPIKDKHCPFKRHLALHTTSLPRLRAAILALKPGDDSLNRLVSTAEPHDRFFSYGSDQESFGSEFISVSIEMLPSVKVTPAALSATRFRLLNPEEKK
jgi:hypothetical protein